MRFTIRDLLWLVLAVALALSWQLDRHLTYKKLATVEDDLDKSTVSERTWKAAADGWEKRYREALNAWAHKASHTGPADPNP